MNLTKSDATAREFVAIPDDLKFRWQGKMTANQWISGNTRLRARSRLTAASWPGNIDAGSRVCAMLTDNAARHGKPLYGGLIGLRLMCPRESDDLIIEVDDAAPDFPAFEESATKVLDDGQPSGLGWVRRCHGRIAWRVRRDDDGQIVGKTVQVVLPSATTDLA
ncbi:hypothetical protein DDJ31_13555 [Streptomyces griseoviridis]|uniref:ATP-binding protein n=1 Tax=Streptomyces griseoviridis TaxID=45398 RepID=A0ABX5TUC1_STRGD|nr:hypothetical protein DDJ31_13555 [Streptomyces griseoviridis]